MIFEKEEIGSQKFEKAKWRGQASAGIV